MSRGRAAAVHRVEFDVDWPPGHVAAYVLDGAEPVLVDAGMPDDAATLQAGLADAGLALGDVEHLLVTHPHLDHVGCVGPVLMAADPTVYAPAGVRERFARDPEDVGDRVRANADAAGLTGQQREEAVRMAVESLERDADLLPVDAVDVWVEPDEPVAVGPHRVEPVHTPGHQADHCCYALDRGDERALLAGDMAIATFRSVLLHDGLDDGVVEAVGAYRTALDRLEALDVDRVYPGHGPVHRDLAGAVALARDSIRALLDRTHAAVGDGASTVPEVAVAIADERPLRYMIPEATSALAQLRAEGRLERLRTDGVNRYRRP